MQLSSFAFVSLAVTEPMTLVRAVSRVLPAAQAIVPGYLAISPDPTVTTVQDLPPQAMSFIALGSKVPSLVFATVVVALLLAFPTFVWWLLWTVRSESYASALPTVFVMLVAIGGYALVTTALGEGLIGAERHNWLGALSMLAAVMLLPFVTWQLMTDLVRARIALTSALGVGILTAGWLLWSQGQPLGLGAMETLSDGEARSLEVSGYALDPWGVRRRICDGRRRAPRQRPHAALSAVTWRRPILDIPTRSEPDSRLRSRPTNGATSNPCACSSRAAPARSRRSTAAWSAVIPRFQRGFTRSHIASGMR